MKDLRSPGVTLCFGCSTALIPSPSMVRGSKGLQVARCPLCFLVVWTTVRQHRTRP